MGKDSWSEYHEQICAVTTSYTFVINAGWYFQQYEESEVTVDRKEKRKKKNSRPGKKCFLIIFMFLILHAGKYLFRF